MSNYDKSIVASGHDLVSKAAADILREGGNAFDAVVAAGFASTVVEQTLTSLGGGGFLLGHSSVRGQNVFFDFFVNTPGLQSNVDLQNMQFYPVTIAFSGAPQVFNVGLGSVAVPGLTKGLLHVHKRLGKMPLKDVVYPAVQYAKGHRLNSFQANFLKLLCPIMTSTATGRCLYGEQQNYIQHNDQLTNLELADFLENLPKGSARSFYHGEIAQAMALDMKEGGGLLTLEDLDSYKVVERKPIKLKYREFELYTSPPPSMGGSLIALSLSLYSACGEPSYAWGSKEYLEQSLVVMQEVERQRQKGVTNPETLFEFLESGIDESLLNMRLFSRGTTHISIADKKGNCASMTCSNGEGSGYFAPGTGIMLNNMMGEDDLHPEGFHSSPPGQRVGSMMSPSLLIKNNDVQLVIGSGGSKRIRTAITQVLRQVVDFRRDLVKAVEAPRLYFDGECLQVEPGFTPEVLADLDVEVNVWDGMDVYFGGVHAVIPGQSGAGDPRRGGVVAEV